MDGISFMLSRWEAMLNGVKTLSTIHPGALLNKPNPCSLDHENSLWQRYGLALDAKRKEILLDYEKFVLPVMNCHHLDTYEAVAVRSSFFIMWTAFERMYIAYKHYISLTPERRNTHAAVTNLLVSMIIPEKDLYHRPDGSVLLVADFIHELYLYMYKLHLARICPPDCTVPVSPIDEYHDLVEAETMPDPDQLRLVWRSDKLDKMMRYACRLASYPVLPADMIGTLVPAADRHDLGNLNILTPGVEARIHVQRPTDPRTCIACRIETLQEGHTDRHEQRTRLKCSCLTQSVCSKESGMVSHHEQSYAVRGAILTRVLTTSGVSTRQRRGCACDIHKTLLLTDLMTLKKTLEDSRVK